MTNTGIERELADILTSRTTLRVQPVAPEDEKPAVIVWRGIATIGSLFLGAWFLCLATLAAHGYWPVVPALAYWPAVGMLLGLQTLAFQVRRPAWKWHRQ